MTFHTDASALHEPSTVFTHVKSKDFYILNEMLTTKDSKQNLALTPMKNSSRQVEKVSSS